MLYSEENVRANIRNRDGKRVFYLGKGDTLTPSARDWLQQQRIPVLEAQMAKPDSYILENGAQFQQKPEHFTHLRGNILVPKTHPVIEFRGTMDTLQAELKEALHILKTEHGCDRLTIQSGGTLNALFLREKLFDYIDIVVAPILIGGKDTSSLVDGASLLSPDELSKLCALKLISCEALENSYVRLRYETIK